MQYAVLETYHVLDAIPIRVASNNPDRISLIFANGDTGDITISTSPSCVFPSGIPVNATQLPFCVRFQNDGSLVSTEWFASSRVPNTILTIIEVTKTK